MENIDHHQANVHQSNEIANLIRGKVNELIGKIKEEERKLLENIRRNTLE